MAWSWLRTVMGPRSEYHAGEALPFEEGEKKRKEKGVNAPFVRERNEDLQKISH